MAPPRTPQPEPSQRALRGEASRGQILPRLQECFDLEPEVPRLPAIHRVIGSASAPYSQEINGLRGLDFEQCVVAPHGGQLRMLRLVSRRKVTNLKPCCGAGKGIPAPQQGL